MINYKETSLKIKELESDFRTRVKELENELQNKIKELEETRKTFHDNHMEQISYWLSLDLINQTRPYHDRTSCNDDNLDNGFIKENHSVPRCQRCYLLKIMKDPYLLDDGVFLRLVAERESD